MPREAHPRSGSRLLPNTSENTAQNYAGQQYSSTRTIWIFRQVFDSCSKGVLLGGRDKRRNLTELEGAT
jgi:hypothetical protein